MTKSLVEEKLNNSEELADNNGAEITCSFIKQMKNKYDSIVHEDRARILYDLAVQQYDRNNISKYAVQQIAKESKIHYFLYGPNKDKMVADVIRLLK